MFVTEKLTLIPSVDSSQLTNLNSKSSSHDSIVVSTSTAAATTIDTGITISPRDELTTISDV